MRLLSFGNGRSLESRSRIAIDSLEEHGEYAIGEFANVTTHNDVNYVTSVGLAFRNDSIPATVRVDMAKAEEARRKKSDES